MKKVALLLMLSVAAMSVSACGKGRDVSEPAQVPASSPVQVDDNNPQAQEEIPVISMPVNVYVSDEDMSDLKEKSVIIEFGDDTAKYLSALEALKGEGEGEVSLWRDAVFHSATFGDGRLTVDLSLPEEARLGAPGEQLAVDALQQTCFQFDEVKELEILVDGEAVESLMGHVYLDHPIVRP
ncbi:GerMN domain-containing protein [Paenibacillus tarimensis]|uniref:GerMN domain-containing protein n=1 Tax=Paenibacillus tarimensis TaxID=416012 RepID=UPI001F2D61E0|nr:GerMN domain-containing protein [Paenibacillus tarimensis]MCF2942610.1 GerMN domain-containing protein [Paenibacillus tarimensis]